MKESGSFFVRQNLIASDPRFAHKDADASAAHDSPERGARRAVARQIRKGIGAAVVCVTSSAGLRQKYIIFVFICAWG